MTKSSLGRGDAAAVGSGVGVATAGGGGAAGCAATGSLGAAEFVSTSSSASTESKSGRPASARLWRRERTRSCTSSRQVFSFLRSPGMSRSGSARFCGCGVT